MSAPDRLRRACRAAFAVACVLLFSAPHAAAQIRLAWNPNPEPDVAGYKVYVGAVSRTYHASIDVGNRTSYTVSGLPNDRPYYFAVTAYTSSGFESEFSVEITTASVLQLAPEDTSLNLNAKNYSTLETLMTYTWPDRRVANAAVLKFDLSKLPPATLVQNATLRLSTVASDGGPDRTYTVSAHRIVGRNPVIGRATGYSADGVTPWTASASCYNNVPLAQGDISIAEDTAAVEQAPGTATWTLTRMVQHWVLNPATNFGVLLNSDASAYADRYRFFASMEHPDAALRPLLHVEYFVPPQLETPPPPVATHVAKLAPRDTSLTLDAVNHSTDPVLMTYTWPAQSVANAVVLKFDLSSLPAGAVVHEATLRLALVRSDTAAESNYFVSAHKIVGKNPVVGRATGYTTDGATRWTPIACCHNGVPLAQADISPAYDTRAIDQTRAEKSWTLTRLVQEWLAEPGTNVGVLLNADGSAYADRYRYFASMEHPDATLRPVLHIVYSVPE